MVDHVVVPRPLVPYWDQPPLLGSFAWGRVSTAKRCSGVGRWPPERVHDKGIGDAKTRVWIPSIIEASDSSFFPLVLSANTAEEKGANQRPIHGGDGHVSTAPEACSSAAKPRVRLQPIVTLLYFIFLLKPFSRFFPLLALPSLFSPQLADRKSVV